VALAGCGAGTTTRTVTEPDAPPPKPAKPKHRGSRLAPARCPAGSSPQCKAVRGLVAYVQAVDPDGDGDAHLAVLDRHGLTYAGITVVKLTRDMRRRRLPRTGEEVSAAGPVQASSTGAPEIRASELHVARGPR
jgi:hypothetical protein